MTSYIKWFELLAALGAIINWKAICKNEFLKHLAFLIFFIVIVEFIGNRIQFYSRYNTVFYNFLVNPGIFILYALAFYKGFEKRKNRQFAVYGIYFVTIVFYLTIFTIDVNRYLNIIGYNFGALFVAFLAILKILEMANKETIVDYWKDPLIYLLLAMIFYYLITIPFYSITYYFYIHKIENNIGNEFLKYIDAFFNYLLYSLYAIIFITWNRKKLPY